MPSTIVIHGDRKEGSSSFKNPPTFGSSDVYLDTIHADSNVAANVSFTPFGRSFWHTHEKGQVLQVTIGSGWVDDKGGRPQHINIGDLIYAAPGTTHWHGTRKYCAMTHFAIGLGKTK